ncbi:calcium-binding protein, partial [Sphingorhabdus wooponensis]
MTLRQIKPGSWSISTPTAAIAGGFNWNAISGSALNQSLLLQRIYYGSSALIDLGGGIDRLTLDFAGAANLDLRNVEFLDGTARMLTTVFLLSSLGNTLTTNGGILNLYGTGRNDTITVTGNRANIMQTNNTITTGTGANLIDLRVGNDRLILVNDIDRTGVDRYDGGAGTNILELRNTNAGMLTVTFTASDLDIQRFQTVFINNLGGGNVTADFSGQSESLLIYDALTTVAAASSGEDIITGGSGADTIYGRSGRDTLFGHIGNDTLYGGADYDVISGGDGIDLIYGNGGYIVLTLNGELTVIGNDVTGGAGADSFYVGYQDNAVTTITSSNVISRTSAATVASSVSRTTFNTETPFGADRIKDWDAGTDNLYVGGGGVAIIDGLYNVSGLTGADTIDLRNGLSGKVVQNSGLIVARGRDGNDTLRDSGGTDFLYGNKGSNQISLASGGTDRVYIDTLSGKQYITGFEVSGDDTIYLDKGVVNALGQNTGRSGTVHDASGGYTNGQTFRTGVDYLYANFYFGQLRGFGPGPYSNAQHDAAENRGDSQKTTPIGGGMVAAGAVLLAATFGIVGASLVVSGGLLLEDAREHDNLTYNGAFNNNAYLNLMTASRTVNSTVGVNDDGTKFLDFFYNQGVVGDGFTPVLELSNKSGASGIYGLVAVRSDDETFIFLIRSSDNLIENHEALKIAEINGHREMSDFVIYDGTADQYNPSADPVLALVEPTITAVKETGTNTAISNGGKTVALSSVVSVSLSPALSQATVIELYDGADLINTVTVSSGSSTTINDSRSIYATVDQIDSDGNGNLNPLSQDNLFRYDYVTAGYSIWVTDTDTGFVTKSNVWAVTYMGIDPSFVIDGGAGFDTLLLEETSDHLNALSNAKLIGIELVDASAAEQAVTIDLTNQTEAFTLSGSEHNDTIKGGAGDDTLIGNKGSDALYGGAGNDIFSYSALSSPSVTAVQSFAADSLVDGGADFDTLRLIGAVTLVDSDFTNTVSVEALDLDNTVNDVTLATEAEAAGTWVIYGGSSTDTISWDYVSLGVEIYGGDGDDVIDNNASRNVADYVEGGEGNDTIRVGAGSDTVYGGAGNDLIYGEDGNDILLGNDGADTLSGGGGVDVLTGNAGNDAMTGGTGADTFNVDAGSDTISDLGDGADIVKVEIGASMTATAVAAWTATSASYNKAAAASAATVTASGYNIDVSAAAGTRGWTVTNSGNATGVALTGSIYADTITGGSGNDTITGGASADSLVGNAGDDVFIIALAGQHAGG